MSAYDDSFTTIEKVTTLEQRASVAIVEARATGDTPSAETTNPLRSPEALDAYCDRVHDRLAERAAQRAAFLRAAHERLRALLDAAREVGDAALCEELTRHLATARELVHAGSRSARPAELREEDRGPWPPLAAPARPAPLDHSSRYTRPLPPRPERPGPAPRPYAGDGSLHQSRGPAIRPGGFGTPGDGVRPEPGPAGPRRPVRAPADIERDAARLREEVRAWPETHPLRNPDGEMNGVNSLLLRALACRHRRLKEEAGDIEVSEVTELGADIRGLLEAAGDQEYTVATDDEITPVPSAYQWGEVSERYEDLAEAQAAFDWWDRHRAALSIADVAPLAEAVAAIQQRFNRLLFRIGARDPFQQRLFDALRTWAREAPCYLYSLRPKAPIAELAQRAATLDAAWQRARLALEAEEAEAAAAQARNAEN